MLLLDTHSFIWLASDTEKLSGKAREVIREESDALFLSGISGLEIALAVKRQRLELPTTPATFLKKALLHHGIRQIPVTAGIGCNSANLPDIHNDPFDRIIIATAQLYGMRVLSKDTVFARYPDIEVVW